MPDSAAQQTMLHGWGRTAPTGARVTVPADRDEVAEAIRAAPGRGVLARGLGRSYGDAAQLAGGRVLSTAGLDELELDAATGTLVAGAGCSLDRVLAVIVPRGWFVPVTPGTRFVSLGGAVAADVHGKNHHVDGSFGAHLNWLELVDGLGGTHRLSPSEQPDRFWATVGGMGLTGVITRVSVRLRPIESAWMTVDTLRAADLDALMATLFEHDRRYPYTVAWVDLGARGRATGRAVITSGDHARAADLADRSDPLRFAPAAGRTVPPLPVGLVGSVAARAFNEAWYRRSPRRPRRTLEPLESFFYPLDGLRSWNRLYGPAGFLQYQLAVPDGAEAVLTQAIGQLQAAGLTSSLAVLKRFGPADPAPLSFPRQGWTLALDLPVSRAARGDRLAAVLDMIDLRVAQSGGAVYLAKDSRLRPELLGQMYPRLEEWRAIRSDLDPLGRFRSDLAARLRL